MATGGNFNHSKNFTDVHDGFLDSGLIFLKFWYATQHCTTKFLRNSLFIDMSPLTTTGCINPSNCCYSNSRAYLSTAEIISPGSADWLTVWSSNATLCRQCSAVVLRICNSLSIDIHSVVCEQLQKPTENLFILHHIQLTRVLYPCLCYTKNLGK